MSVRAALRSISALVLAALILVLGVSPAFAAQGGPTPPPITPNPPPPPPGDTEILPSGHLPTLPLDVEFGAQRRVSGVDPWNPGAVTAGPFGALSARETGNLGRMEVVGLDADLVEGSTSWGRFTGVTEVAMVAGERSALMRSRDGDEWKVQALLEGRLGSHITIVPGAATDPPSMAYDPVADEFLIATVDNNSAVLFRVDWTGKLLRRTDLFLSGYPARTPLVAVDETSGDAVVGAGTDGRLEIRRVPRDAPAGPTARPVSSTGLAAPLLVGVGEHVLIARAWLNGDPLEFFVVDPSTHHQLVDSGQVVWPGTVGEIRALEAVVVDDLVVVAVVRASDPKIVALRIDEAGQIVGHADLTADVFAAMPSHAGATMDLSLAVEYGSLLLARTVLEGNFGFTDLLRFGLDGGPVEPVPPVIPLTPGGTAPSLPSSPGYWIGQADGVLHSFGSAPSFADIGPTPGSVIVDTAVTPTGDGLWALDSAGGIHTRGDAGFFGAPSIPPGHRPVALSATVTGAGYWVFTSAGLVLPFGDAVDHGDVSHLPLNAPVIDAVPTATGLGYWMLAEDGGVFSFGDATFHGSTGSMVLNAPAIGLVADPDGVGYWFVASDGGVFAFDAPFRGSMGGLPLNEPMVGMTSYGDGYVMVAADGGAFVFSSEPFLGSLGGQTLTAPVSTLLPR